MSVWENPLFQRNYRMPGKHRLKVKWPIWVNYFIGLAVTVICNSAHKLVWGPFYDPESIPFLTVFIPGLVGISIYISLSGAMPIYAVILQIKKDIGSGTEDKLLMSTPLTSREIFLSECLPISIKGMGAFVPFVFFTLGMVTAYLLGDTSFRLSYLETFPVAGYAILIIPVLLLAYFVFLMHHIYTSLIAGTTVYIGFYPAILFTILRVCFTVGISLLPIVWIYISASDFFYDYLPKLNSMGLAPLLVTLPIILLIQAFAIGIAADDGASVIERYRRTASDEEYNKRIDKESDPFYVEP
jgi:hypothetical protein